MNNISTTLHKEPDLPVVDFFNPKKDARLTKRKHLKAKKRKKQKKHLGKILSKTSVTSENNVSEMDSISTQEAKRQDGNEINEEFANAVTKIMTKEISPDSGAAIMMASSKESREVEEHIKKEKQRVMRERELLRQKQLLMNKDHFVPEVLNNEWETKLRKIATKGVVQLFNALNKQQKLAAKTKSDPKQIDKLTKEKFLALLKASKQNPLSAADVPRLLHPTAKSTVLEQNKKRNCISEEKNEPPKWEVLRDDYLLGAKMRDWNKPNSETNEDHSHFADDEKNSSENSSVSKADEENENNKNEISSDDDVLARSGSDSEENKPISE
jgi:hypothetical protein